MSVVDWDALMAAAAAAMEHAYAPYSNFPVGAAALVDDGRVVSGCNVENGSYGLALCAECGLVSALHRAAAGGWSRSSASTGPDADATPCGRCRQLLWEHGGADLLVLTERGPVPMSDAPARRLDVLTPLRRVVRPCAGQGAPGTNRCGALGSAA